MIKLLGRFLKRVKRTIMPYFLCKTRMFNAAYGEDAVIKGMCDRQEIVIKTYLDIGANHPINGNATYLFYCNGARGYLIEPNKKHAEELRKVRPKDQVLSIGLSADENNGQILEYYNFEEQYFHNRNTFDAEIAEKVKRAFHTNYRTEYVEVRSINSLIDDGVIKDNIDYISIDVEGHEWEILKGFNFQKNHVKIFNIEKGSDKVKELILRNGYRIAGETLSNWIFVKKELVTRD